MSVIGLNIGFALGSFRRKRRSLIKASSVRSRSRWAVKSCGAVASMLSWKMGTKFTFPRTPRHTGLQDTQEARCCPACRDGVQVTAGDSGEIPRRLSCNVRESGLCRGSPKGFDWPRSHRNAAHHDLTGLSFQLIKSLAACSEYASYQSSSVDGTLLDATTRKLHLASATSRHLRNYQQEIASTSIASRNIAGGTLCTSLAGTAG